MAAIVEKVKEKVRGRSRSRRSFANGEERASNEINDSRHTGTQDSRDLEQTTAPKISSPTLPAWHVHKANTNSMDSQGVPQVPPIDPQYYHNSSLEQPDGTRTASSYGHRHTASVGSENVPTRISSARNQPQSAEQRTSEDMQRAGAQYPHTVPRRKESLPQNRAGRVSLDKRRSRNRDSLEQGPPYPQTQEYSNNSAPVRYNGDHAALLPEQPRNKSLGTEIDQALSSMSINDRTAQQMNGYNSHSNPTTEALEHLRLPQGFNLGSSVRTVIDTEWKPAITHEHKYHERTEIIREAITRDIHIHHYYTYLQPIKVVEVLPARHYQLDPRTGLKVEIPAPAGWMMPENLQPRQEDHSFVKGWERHYLVNDDYPHGIEEPAPSSNGISNQRPGY